jgi:hypothetical protein
LKKFMILASVVAIVVAALALPALAQSRSDEERQAEQFAAFLDHYFYGDDDDDRWEDNNWWKDHEDKDWWNDHEDNDWWNDHDDDDDFDKVGAPVVNQESSQEAQSGDIDQSFTVTNSGDNSNQCAGVQGVANTGNAQNQISVVQNGSEADDFSFEDSGSSIEVNPTNYTSCDQQVNQAASAAYYGGW